MTMRLKIAGLAGLAMLAALGGCGGSEEGRGGLSAEEERQLDNAAAMLDDNSFDVSPDSLVANEEDLEEIDSESANAVEVNAQ